MHDEASLLKKRAQRIRRVKWFLKFTPRRAFLHRYPFIKIFAATARKRAYLWSFKRAEAIPALYIGSIISFMPLYGIQIPVAFFLSLVFHCNLMIMVALQFITNPLTIGPVYAVGYKIGSIILYGMSVHIDWIPFVSDQVGTETVSAIGEKARSGVQTVLSIFWKTTIGGIFMGYVFGFAASIIYRQGAKRAQDTYERIKAFRDAKNSKGPPPPNSEELAKDEEAFL